MAFTGDGKGLGVAKELGIWGQEGSMPPRRWRWVTAFWLVTEACPEHAAFWEVEHLALSIGVAGVVALGSRLGSIFKLGWSFPDSLHTRTVKRHDVNLIENRISAFAFSFFPCLEIRHAKPDVVTDACKAGTENLKQEGERPTWDAVRTGERRKGRGEGGLENLF